MIVYASSIFLHVAEQKMMVLFIYEILNF